MSLLDRISETTLGKPKNWLLRSGSFSLLAFVAITLILSFFIKYPDSIEAQVNIISITEPVLVVAKSEGLLKLDKEIEGLKVLNDTKLGFIQNDIDYDRFIEIKDLLKTLNVDDVNLNTDSLKFRDFSKYGSFEHLLKKMFLVIENYSFQQANSFSLVKIVSLQEDIKMLYKLIDSKKYLLSNDNSRLELIREDYTIDSIFYIKNTVSKVEFNQSKQELISALKSKALAEEQILRLEYDLQNKKNEINELNAQYILELKEAKNRIVDIYSEIENKLNEWEYNQVIRSPTKGIISFHKSYESDKYTQRGDELLYILPEQDQIYATTYVNSVGFGSVVENQEVIIKLNDFPYEEYGYLTGKTSKIAPLLTEKGYFVRIELTDGLVSSSNYNFDFKHNMSGNCEIITKDKRLISRLIQPLNYYFSNNK
ncbi:MAG: HlyD family efflux transporter periplasmic adaptor subunit [Cytophagales bacterium]|nr:HlyD family efflux transporter periplasmic adaptor subunit [Cytophagales bacterium]